MSHVAITKQKKQSPPLPPSLDGSRILSAKQAAEMLGISLCTLRRLHWAAKLPAPIQLSTRRIGWKVADLLAFVECSRAAEAK
jgi:predicted DNA-binding transcriptional regulator AlpA